MKVREAVAIPGAMPLPQGHAMGCYDCSEPLGAWSGNPTTPDTYLPSTLVPRGKHDRTGLPRYGAPRGHGGHEARPRVRGQWASVGRGAFRYYVNCPACDRGQVVNLVAGHPQSD